MRLLFKLSIISILVFQSICFAQNSDPTLRRIGFLDSNNIQLSFYNDGAIAGFNLGTDIRGNWHGLDYIGDLTPLIGLEFQNSLGETLHSVIISRGPRNGQSNEKHPTNGYFWGFNPLPGYLNPSEQSVAMSNNPNSWPTTWADHPEYGSNVWNGLFGPDSTVATLESYFRMDDTWDDEFNAHFLSDSTDSMKKGYGINIGVRYLQLKDSLYNDMLFRVYDISNEGTYSYKKVVFGSVTGTLAGGDGDAGDDLSYISKEENYIYSWDQDGLGNIGQKVGVSAEAFLQSPDSEKIGSFHFFYIFSSPGMDNDELLWNNLQPEKIDSIIPVPQDGDYIYGTNYFSLAPKETVRIASVIVFGYTQDEVGQKVLAARALWNSKFNKNSVRNSVAFTNLQSHRTLTGAETIEWTATDNSGSVDLWYSPDQGEHWQLIEKSIPNTGSYEFESASVPDSPFGVLRIFIKNALGDIYAFSESHEITVNNSTNDRPYVRILNQGFEKDGIVNSDSLTMQILLGDAENDSVTVSFYFSNDNGGSFSQFDSLRLSTDTIAMQITINIAGLQNTNAGIIKMDVSDGNLVSTAQTERFKKKTVRDTVAFSHIGLSSLYTTVPWSINIVDSSQLTGHDYLISFDDTDRATSKKYISVYDRTSDAWALSHEPFLPDVESPLFGGLSFVATDRLTSMDSIRTGWNSGHVVNETFTFDRLVSQTNSINNGYRKPVDYQIIFYPTNSYTSIADTLYPNTPSNRIPAKASNFRVVNKTTGEDVPYVYYTTGTISIVHGIWFKEDVKGEVRRTWIVKIIQSPNAPALTSDTLFLYTKKGLSAYDSIQVFNVTTPVGKSPELPLHYSLEQNYPNPFNPVTTIAFTIPQRENISLSVYDVLGRKVSELVHDQYEAGRHEVSFDASYIASGVYFYKIEAGRFHESKKLLIIK